MSVKASNLLFTYTSTGHIFSADEPVSALWGMKIQVCSNAYWPLGKQRVEIDSHIEENSIQQWERDPRANSEHSWDKSCV